MNGGTIQSVVLFVFNIHTLHKNLETHGEAVKKLDKYLITGY